MMKVYTSPASAAASGRASVIMVSMLDGIVSIFSPVPSMIMGQSTYASSPEQSLRQRGVRLCLYAS